MELPAALLCSALDDASRHGYNIAGLSGGEPLLYPELAEVLRHALDLNMVTTVTTNGMLLTEARLSELRDVVSLLAISLDGVPASHDEVRGSPRAFSSMRSRLSAVRDSGIPFGFIFTLTQHNLHELDWVAEFATQEGAQLLQVHPLEEVGRAASDLQGSEPDAIELGWAFAEVARLGRINGRELRVHLDVVPAKTLRAQPRLAFGGLDSSETRDHLADLLSPLVIETDGTVSPIQYGFARKYCLGNLHDESLDGMAKRWLANGSRAFLELCQETFADVTDVARPPVLNWYRELDRSAG